MEKKRNVHSLLKGGLGGPSGKEESKESVCGDVITVTLTFLVSGPLHMLFLMFRKFYLHSFFEINVYVYCCSSTVVSISPPPLRISLLSSGVSLNRNCLKPSLTTLFHVGSLPILGLGYLHRTFNICNCLPF